MNKKILSCALVAAMLASSVGAMGVSAADNNDAFTNYYKDVANVHIDLQIAVADGFGEGEFAGTYFTDDLEEGKADPKAIYLENYKPADEAENGVSFDDVVEAVADAEGKVVNSKEYNAAVRALANYFEGREPANWQDDVAIEEQTGLALNDSVTKETDTGRSVSDRRTDALDALEDNVQDIKDNFDTSFYDKDELELYAIEFLIARVNAVGNNLSTPTTRIEYINYEYERLLGEDGMLSTSTSWEDTYAQKLEDAEALTEDDYTASNWAKVEYQMRLAALEAEKDTAAGYKAACAALDVIFDTIETVKPDYSALEDAIEGLYKEGETPETGAYSGTSAAGCIYLKNDYKDGKNVPDEWWEFAGNTESGDDYIEGAYRRAYDIYSKCQRSSTRKYVAQSTVDKVLEELNDAIFALDPNYETSNWVIVMLEDALEVANNVVEDDFRTTSSYWKNFVKDKEYIEKLLEQDSVKEKVAKAAVEALLGDDMDATKGTKGSLAELSKCKLTVPTATKNDLKDAIKAAKDLLEDKTGKTSSQITTLQNALDDAEEIDNDNTISEYENATTTLEDAMTNYEHPQGWYQDNNGTWFYGREDANVTGWLNVNGVWYLLDSETGAMKTGWQQVNGTWYYMNASGAMQTGWLNLNGTYYYLESWGGMATGWKSVNGSWYYLQPSSGAMVANGWYWINGKCYYFYNWGGMAANTTIDGYKVDASGAWVK